MECKYCGNEVPISRAHKQHTKFCSDDCCKKWHLMFRGPQNNTSTSTTGSIYEYIVVADLMKNGFFVFKSTSLNSPCDLIAMKNKMIFKVEVTTGLPRVSGGYSHNRKEKNYDYDILALVIRGNQVVYLIQNKEINPLEITNTD